MKLQLANKALSSDANSVAITDYKTVSVWAIPAETQIVPERSLPQSPPIVSCVFNASLTKALLVSTKSARVLDLSTAALGSTIPLQPSPSAFAIFPQGDAVAIAYPDGSLQIYSAGGIAGRASPGLNRSEIMQVAGPRQSIRNLNFSADGNLVYALFGEFGGAANTAQSGSGFYAWRVQAAPLSATSIWAQLGAYLKNARGAGMTSRARQSI